MRNKVRRSLSLLWSCNTLYNSVLPSCASVRLYDSTTGEGVGALDFLDGEESSVLRSRLTEDMIEKWWCLGDARNRVVVWVQGNSLL